MFSIRSWGLFVAFVLFVSLSSLVHAAEKDGGIVESAVLRQPPGKGQCSYCQTAWRQGTAGGGQ